MKNTYKVSAISFIALIIFSFISVIFMTFWFLVYKNIYPIYPIILVNSVLAIFYYNGLLKLGNQYSSKLLKVGSIMRISITIIMTLVCIFFLAYYQKDINKMTYSIFDQISENNELQSSEQSGSDIFPPTSSTDSCQTESSNDNIEEVSKCSDNRINDPVSDFIKSNMVWVIIYLVIYAIVFFLPEIFIGFGFLKITDDKIRYSKATGIISLIYGFGSMLLLILNFIMLLLFTNSMLLPMITISLFNNILSIIMLLISIVLSIFILIILFNESGKIEKNNK